MPRSLPAPPRRSLLAAAVPALLLLPLLLPGTSAVPRPGPQSAAAGREPPPVEGAAGAASGASGAATSSAVVDLRAGTPPGTGWRAPVAGRPLVLRPFAPGPERWSPGHRGVDLAGEVDGPVLAAGPGRVVFAGAVAGRGVVSVAHGALRTTYEPVLPAVARGDVVVAGSPLGTLAAGHPPCGGCLHWGLRRGEDYLDPLRLLRPVRVRLLPLTGAPR